MRFTTLVLSALVAFSSLVSAQTSRTTSPPAPTNTLIDTTDNQINYPTQGTVVVIGSKTTIRWTPTTNDPVILRLRRGNRENLSTVADLTTDGSVRNSGSFDWTPSTDLPNGSDYTIQIISGSRSNYSPAFTISSTSSTSTSSSTSSSSSSTSTTLSTSTSNTSTTSTTSGFTRSATTTSGGSNSTSSTPRSSTSSRAPASTTTSAPGGGASSINSAGQLASPFALVFCVLAGIMYMN